MRGGLFVSSSRLLVGLCADRAPDLARPRPDAATPRARGSSGMTHLGLVLTRAGHCDKGLRYARRSLRRGTQDALMLFHGMTAALCRRDCRSHPIPDARDRFEPPILGALGRHTTRRIGQANRVQPAVVTRGPGLQVGRPTGGLPPNVRRSQPPASEPAEAGYRDERAGLSAHACGAIRRSAAAGPQLFCA